MKIEQNIVAVSVVKDQEEPKPETVKPVLLKRSEELTGSTYKIKTPISDHALYVTINNIEENGKLRPFEIFINSKNMENFAWIVALTRVISSVFRHGGDSSFLIEELCSVFDPKGGYWKPGGKYMPSLIAEIGYCLESHMIKIGAIVKEPIIVPVKYAKKESEKPLGSMCPKCNQMALVVLDGCETCLDCGDSKCG